jgi:hypothetical protein
MLDPTAHLGNALLYRHGLFQELFPSFTSFNHEDDYCHHYILCSIRHHHHQPMGPPRVLSDGWDNVNEACGIEVEKLTHIFRVQTQQEVTDKAAQVSYCLNKLFTRLFILYKVFRTIVYMVVETTVETCTCCFKIYLHSFSIFQFVSAVLNNSLKPRTFCRGPMQAA